MSALKGGQASTRHVDWDFGNRPGVSGGEIPKESGMATPFVIPPLVRQFENKNTLCGAQWPKGKKTVGPFQG